jgi:DUF2934 family protein
MIDRKANPQPKPKIVVGPKSSSGKAAVVLDPAPSQDRIRERAYELYESRGRRAGHDEQDWLRAEREILKRKR